jgi:hypothetical protein
MVQSKKCSPKPRAKKMNYDENKKPKTPKIKLTSEPEPNWLAVDYLLVGLFAGIMAIILTVGSCNKPASTELPLEQPKVEDKSDSKGKTWSEPDSARDAFDRNFGR